MTASEAPRSRAAHGLVSSRARLGGECRRKEEHEEAAVGREAAEEQAELREESAREDVARNGAHGVEAEEEEKRAEGRELGSTAPRAEGRAEERGRREQGEGAGKELLQASRDEEPEAGVEGPPEALGDDAESEREGREREERGAAGRKERAAAGARREDERLRHGNEEPRREGLVRQVDEVEDEPGGERRGERGRRGRGGPRCRGSASRPGLRDSRRVLDHRDFGQGAAAHFGEAHGQLAGERARAPRGRGRPAPGGALR